jgi:hypothetical protein
MAQRVAVGLLVAVGCYSPDVRDCTLTCTDATDCASGQVCGTDRLCAAPAQAGRCARVLGMYDAGEAVDARADGSIDAHPDAAELVSIQVTVTGKGEVSLDGGGTCTGHGPAVNCVLGAIKGSPATVRAMGLGGNHFMAWSGACDGELPSCTFTPFLPVTDVGASFH